MASTKDNGSRRRAQVQTETSLSVKKISKKKIDQKKVKKERGLRPGQWGVCETWLWKFTGHKPTHQGLQVEQVAAESLDEALRFLRRRFPNFDIRLVEYLDLVPLVSGWPLQVVTDLAEAHPTSFPGHGLIS